MPLFPGEDRLLTLFADVHYYFTIPTPNPAYHRFDKGSYLYVYHDPARGSARLEIANNPGTNDQDAFQGALDTIHIVHSTRFPTLCTVTVGSQVENSPVSAHSPVGSQDQWRLPFIDHRDQSKRTFRLHTLDIYFWTADDADQFLDAVARFLSPQQLESDRPVHSQAAPEPAVSRVVEQLENVAITDPAYQNGQTRDSRSESKPTTEEPAKEETATDYTPLAYNPAAPAAPEPIKHREKTPPPEDAGEGTGLAAAAVADQSQYSIPTQPVGSFSQPQSYAIPGLSQYGYSSPPPSAAFHGPPSYSKISLSSPPPTQAGGMSFAPPPQNPNAHLIAQNPFESQESQVSQQHTHQSNHSESANHLRSNSHDVIEDERVAIAGYSKYSYSQPVQHQYGQLASEYDIHSHIYVPTEAELKGSKHSKPSSQPPKRGTKLEAGLSRVDSKVNSFFKRIEKKVG